MEKIEMKELGRKEALEILSKNDLNRKPTRANIDFIKSEMIGGKFVVNGSTIVISEDGTLIDGQHRLLALSETDLRFNFIIVYNAKKESFSSIDTGKCRNAGDILSTVGIKHHNAVASCCRRVMFELDGKRKNGKSGAVKLSNKEILDFYENNSSEIIENIRFATNLYQSENRILQPSLAASLIMLLSRQSRNEAKSFIREIYTGNKEKESNAAIILRKRLINMKIKGEKMVDSLARALFITAFNHYISNSIIKQISINKEYKEYSFIQI